MGLARTHIGVYGDYISCSPQSINLIEKESSQFSISFEFFKCVSGQDLANPDS
jgi:hypothetical protein|tara:strand:- start:292 stop:450 length:159 start_codon:yes stop_codon:yes gene_type:complete